MRGIRAIVAAAALLATLVNPAVARADGIPAQTFYADSGDSCAYGYTKGTLLWRSPGPLVVIAVDVSGVVVDRPLPAEPTICRDDGFYTTATFTAYAGSVAVDSRQVKANNAEVRFQFTLGANSTAAGLTHLVIQVCRDPIVTLPPSYCGRAVKYSPTAITPTT
jgi:hypothetical protein